MNITILEVKNGIKSDMRILLLQFDNLIQDLFFHYFLRGIMGFVFPDFKMVDGQLAGLLNSFQLIYRIYDC